MSRITLLSTRKAWSRSHIISVRFGICHKRSESLRESPVLPHPPDPPARSLQLFHHFSPGSPRPQFRKPLACVAKPEPQSRGGKCGFIFTAFHSGKAECPVNCSAHFYPLRRPDNVSQRRNLTSSRLDPRSSAVTERALAAFLLWLR